MDSVLSGNVWKQVARQANAAKRRLAAVAYVSSSRHVRFKRGDVLICDASDRAVECGETSARFLGTLYRAGIELRCRPDLHAKIAVFGNHVLLGSCNLSASSEEQLTEVALLSERKQLVAQATAFIHGLREHSSEIDAAFIQRIRKIKVRLRKRLGRKRRPVTPTRLGDKAWLVSVRQLPDDCFPKERPLVQAGEKRAKTLVADRDATISWIRWTGNSGFRSTAQAGDVVVQIWKSLSGKTVSVLPPSPIVHRQDAQHWTRFYVSDSDAHDLSWKRFVREAKARGVRHISKNAVRELTSREALSLEGVWT